MDNYLEKWVEIFGDAEYAFDIANVLILKKEYKTNNFGSWDIDYYDYNDDEIFIASEQFIKHRNKASAFVFDNEKYFVTKNEDFTYSIIAQNKLCDQSNPFNYDLLILNQISNKESNQNQKYTLLSIVYKKMNFEVDELFKSYLNQVISKIFKINCFRINDDNEFKTKLTYQINLDNINYRKLLSNTLLIPTIIDIAIFRLKERIQNIWMYENNDDSLFNVFLFEPENNKVMWNENDSKFLNHVETFENKIILNEKIVKNLIASGMESIKFIKLYEFDNNPIYIYNYANSRFKNYLHKISKK